MLVFSDDENGAADDDDDDDANDVESKSVDFFFIRHQICRLFFTF